MLVDRKSRLDWNGLRGKIRHQGMRNSNCLAIAPTATISNIMGCTPCIEPSYKHIHTKSNMSGEFVRTNDFLVKELMTLGLWDEEMLSDLKYFDGSIQGIERVPAEVRRLYKTAFEIEPTWLLQCAAVRQKWIDQSQSVNLFLAENDARKSLVHVPRGVGARSQDDLLPAHDQQVVDRFQQSRAAESGSRTDRRGAGLLDRGDEERHRPAKRANNPSNLMGIKSDTWIKPHGAEGRDDRAVFADAGAQDGGWQLDHQLRALQLRLRPARVERVQGLHQRLQHRGRPKAFDEKSFVDIETDICIVPPNSFALARSIEYFRIPRDVITICLGKSTYARCGIIVNVTPFEPEWEGHVTLEISNTTPLPARIYANEGLAQVLFIGGDEVCEVSYADRSGKYMKQRGITTPKA